MKKEKIKKFFGSKIFMFCFLFAIFGIATIIATGIGSSGYSGIQVDNYYSGNGNQGITQEISFEDADGNNHSLEFEDGLLINYSLEEPPEPPEFPKEGLISYYAMEEGFGTTLVNEILWAENLTLVNGTGWTPFGKVGNALSCDGIDDFALNHDWVGPTTGNITVSAWINSNKAGVIQRFVGRFDQVGADPDEVFALSIRNDDGSFEGIAMNSGWNYLQGTSNVTFAWHHVVMTYNLTNHHLYVDGILEATDSESSGLADDGFGLAVCQGSDFSPGSEFFGGVLDEVGIWNRSLTYEEIELLYNEGNGLTYN